MLTNEDQALIDELWRKYYHLLLTISYRLLDQMPEYRPLAEDCVQLTFEKAVRKITVLRRHTNPYLWLKQTCVNITLSERRKQRNRQRLLNYPVEITDDGDIADTRNCVEDWTLREDLADKKEQLLAEMSDQEQAVFNALFEQNRTYQETAKAMNITEGAVRSTARRIRKKARKILFSILALIAHVLHASRNIII